MQKELPVRKKNRLQGYNYSLNGVYYLTLCVKGKHNLLGEVVVKVITNRPQIILSDYGKIVDKAINNIPQYYPQINVDKYVIMPNHIHMILIVGAITNRPDMDDASGRSIASGRLIIAPTTVSNVIKGMKSYVTKQIGFSMWQKSFHDHIILDEEDYWYRWQYIEKNPAKWAEDEFFSAS